MAEKVLLNGPVTDARVTLSTTKSDRIRLELVGPSTGFLQYKSDLLTSTPLRLGNTSHSSLIVLTTPCNGELLTDLTDYLATHFKTLTNSLNVSRSSESLSYLVLHLSSFYVPE